MPTSTATATSGDGDGRSHQGPEPGQPVAHAQRDLRYWQWRKAGDNLYQSRMKDPPMRPGAATAGDAGRPEAGGCRADCASHLPGGRLLNRPRL